MRLPLTTDQAAQIEPHMRPGLTMLARIERETFAGTNGATSGRLMLIFIEIRGDRMDAVRAAIAGEAAPPLAKRSKVMPSPCSVPPRCRAISCADIARGDA